MQPKFKMVLVFLWVALCGTATTWATETFASADNNQADVPSLTSVYSHYADAIKQHGGDGLKKMASPNFTMHLGGKTFKGKKAFAELDRYVGGLRDGEFIVNIQQVTINGNTAVALTEETLGWSYPDRSIARTQWYWKQTWHKTPQGWELATSDQRVPKTRKNFQASHTV